MRIDNFDFGELNRATSLEPIIVVALSFDQGNTDVHYLTSRTVDGLSGNIINNTLRVVSSTSQKITPEKALSTIGNISFECLDFGLSDLQRTKLLSQSKGLKNKRARIHFGYVGLPWNKYVIVSTQIITDSISFKDGVIKFSCSDVQRLARKKLFVLKETYLTASISSTDTSIPAANTSQFDLVYQPPFNEALAPGDEIGLLKIEQDGVFEIIKWTSKNSTNFLGCERGLFGTPRLDIEVSPGSRGPVIEEFVYLSAPAIMVAYALYTGSWYGHPGKFLPDHWHLGVSTDYLKTSDFISFSDLWDVNDINAGIPATVIGVSDVDGKQFIETQIYYMLSLYSPVNVMGELGLKRLSSIASTDQAERVLDATNIVSYGQLQYDTNEVVNRYIIKWDYSIKTDSYKRASVLIDPDSIQKHTASDIKVIELRTLFGSNDSQRVINHNFENLRARTSSPPYRLSLELTPDQNDLEVGDLVSVYLDSLVDINFQGTGFARVMEVQSVKIDWVTGRVSVDLLGSSSPTAALTPIETDVVDTSSLSLGVPSTNYLTPSNTRFSGNITSSGGITRITGNIHLSGDNSLNAPAAIYYCPEELQIDPGIVVTHDLNVQIRTPGYLTVNGKLDAKGRGYAGGTDSRSIGKVYDSTDRFYSSNTDSQTGSGSGIRGGVGTTLSGRGLLYSPPSQFITYYRLSESPAFRDSLSTNIKQRIRLEDTFISIDSNGLHGLPDSLIGTSGSCGSASWDSTGEQVELIARGGQGGASGGGLCIISSGFALGENGTIDLSGDDGQLGELSSGLSFGVYGGSGGGGHCGGLLIISLDSSQYTEPKAHPNIILNNGLCPLPTAPALFFDDAEGFYNTPQASKSYYGQAGKDRSLTNHHEAFTRLVYLDATASYEPVGEEYVESVPAFTLTKYDNTPVTPDGDRTTIEVSVTPPADSNYSYSLVEYRIQGVEAWTPAPPASHESVFVVPSDGATYEVRIRPVSKQGTPTPSGPVDVITVGDITGKTDAELALIYPLDPITGLTLKDQAGTVFKGLDAEFEWDNSNSEYIYFNYYLVTIISGAIVLRTEKTTSPFYSYTLQKNIQDFFKLNGTRGVYNDIEIRIKPISKYLNVNTEYYSGVEATFSVSSSTVDDRDNLRFYLSYEQQILDDIAVALQQNSGGLNNFSYAGGAYLYSVDGGQYKSLSGPTGAIRIVLPVGYTNTMVSFDVEVNQYVEGSQMTFSVAGFLSSGLSKWAMTTAKATTTQTGNPFTIRFGLEGGQAVVYIGETTTNWAQPEVIIRNVKVSGQNYSIATWQENWSVLINSNAFSNVSATVTDTLIVSSDTLKLGGIPAANLVADIASALDAAQNAEALADGKVAVFFRSSFPNDAESDVGDLLFHTGQGNKIYKRTGPSTWVETDDIRIAQALNAAQTAETIADGKAYVYYQTSTPTNPTPSEGDLWYHLTAKELRRLTSGVWQIISTNGADWSNIDNIPIRFSDTASVGLNITSTHMGYNSNGTVGGWRTYINDLGHMYLNSGGSDNYLAWNGSTLTVRGNIQATSVSAGAIDGETITGGNFRTADVGNDRMILRTATNSLEAYWADSAGYGQHIQIGRATAAGYTGQWMAKYGLDNGNSKDNGIFIRTSGEGATGLLVNSSHPNSGTAGSFTGSAVGVRANGGNGVAVIGAGSSLQEGAAFSARAGSYHNFRGTAPAIIPVSDITALNSNFETAKGYAEGRAVVVTGHSTTSIDKNNYLFNVELGSTGSDPACLGVITHVRDIPSTIETDSYYADSKELFWPHNLSSFHSSHHACLVAVSGIVMCKVTIVGGPIIIGDLVTIASNSLGLLMKATGNGAHIVGKALASATTHGQKIPVLLGGK